jgi:hypothetical protein
MRKCNISAILTSTLNKGVTCVLPFISIPLAGGDEGEKKVVIASDFSAIYGWVGVR